VADFEPDVPEVADQALQLFLRGLAGFRWQQDQQVDIRCREQLAATVAADRRQRQRGGEVEGVPEFLEYRIDLRTAFAEQGAGIVAAFVVLPELKLVGLDLGAQGNVAVHQTIQSGFGRQPAECVSTS
jgi:hypothetical protein